MVAVVETLAGSTQITPGFLSRIGSPRDDNPKDVFSWFGPRRSCFQHKLPLPRTSFVRQPARHNCSSHPHALPCTCTPCPVLSCLMFDRAAEREALERRQAEARILAMELRRKEMTVQVRTKVRGAGCGFGRRGARGSPEDHGFLESVCRGFVLSFLLVRIDCGNHPAARGKPRA